MQAAGPVNKGRHQKSSQKNGDLLFGENILHDPVNGNGAKQGQERIKNEIDIIMAKAKQVEQGHDLNKEIRLEVVPPGVVADKKIGVAAFVTIAKQAEKKFSRI